MRHWLSVLAAAAMAGCAPQIKLLEVSAADGAPRIHSDGGLKVRTGIKPSSNSQSPRLALHQLSPAGPDIARPLQRTGTDAAGVETHESVLAAGDATVALPQGSKWNATVTVPYVYGWSTETVTQSAAFQVLEPANCFGFTTAPGSPRWSLRGFFKNDASIAVAAISSEFYEDLNFPQPSEGDLGFGFKIGAIPTGNWAYNDFWSAEFISPALSGGNIYASWAETKAYTFRVRTEADNIQIQAIITTLDNTGAVTHTYRLLDAQQNPVFWTVPNDGAWHSFSVDFRPQGTAPGHVLTNSLRVFGRPADLQGNAGKRVVIDQLCRMP